MLIDKIYPLKDIICIKQISQFKIKINIFINNIKIKSEMQKVILTLSLIIMAVIAAPVEHQVTSLNGFYDFSKEFKMYSGYITIQETPLIKAHYVLITAKNKPETSDVVLWSNGGPGCSSLIGFLTEIGPHILYPGSETLAPTKNPYSWNNNANILFFQSPPGVGFSINNDPNYQYNDSRTASDSLATLKGWFKLFPEYSMNKFWIAGQSYCGMYIPLLTADILKDINNIVPSNKLNFQGILIGNGVMLTSLHWRRQARNTFYSRHYFYGPQITELIAHCKYDQSDDTNAACIMGNKLADEAVKRINPYNSIGICYQRGSEQNGRKQRKFWYSAFDEEMYNSEDNQLSCSSDDNGMHIYFNDPKVQGQLHVERTLWEPCSDKVGQTYKKDVSTLKLFDSFKTAGLNILLFSGNIDAQVSYVETQEYVKRIGWEQTQAKMSVKNPRGSLQAWYTKYDGLTMYIVNGAGHMVPTDKPAAALRMFQAFIGGKI